MYSDTSNNDSEWPTRGSSGHDPVNVSVGGSNGPPAAISLADARVLVVGPGWLGACVVERLREAGAEVWTLRRTATVASPTSAPAESDATGQPAPRYDLSGDVALAAADRALLGQLPSRLTHVVLCIAPARARGDTHASSYPPAARGAVALAARLGARSVLYTSSTGVYGRTDGAVVDEASPLARDDERQRALVEAEEIVLGDAAAAGLGATVLRVAGLYGPDRDPARRVLEAAARGGVGESWGNYAWRDDVASAVLHLLADARSASTRRIFNCADGTPMRSADVAWGLGFDAADPTMHAPSAAVPTSGVRADVARSNQRVSVDRLRANGWSPAMPTVLHGLAALGHTVRFPHAPTQVRP